MVDKTNAPPGPAGRRVVFYARAACRGQRQFSEISEHATAALFVEIDATAVISDPDTGEAPRAVRAEPSLAEAEPSLAEVAR